jgi:hypothetical protein
MPERQADNNGIWTYPTAMPSMDAKVNPHAVTMPKLVEAVGLDGRFMGALRPFPGMADKTVHGVPKPEAGMTITTINNVVFAKYASIQKGTSRDVLKGIVLIGDNQGGTGQSAYFAYYDTDANSDDVIELEDFDSWDDFKLTSLSEYDVTSLGRYIYFCASGDTTSTVTQWDGKAAPYNKAYFWDFKINDWDKFVTGFDGRFMGLMPERVLGIPLNEDDDGSYLQDSENSFNAEIYGPTGHVTPEGEYTYAAQLISRKHNLRSYLRWRTTDQTFSTNSALRYFIDEIKLPVDGGGDTNQIRGNTHSLTCIINWGIPHCDGFRLWRSPVNDIGIDANKYTLVGSLYLVDDYLEKGVYDSGSGLLQITIDHDSLLGTVHGDMKSTWFTDEGLVTQQLYDPFLHDMHAAPRFKRLQAYDGLLVGVTDIEEPSSPNKNWKDREKVPEAIAWSSLSLNEPENFPPDQQYRPDSAAERFFSLEPVGDHLFGVTNSGIYRVSRSGSQMAINHLQSGIGGVSRFGQTGVGNSLFVVTPAGLKQVDGNTGAINSVTVLDRVILDDSEWAGSLTAVHMEFDARIGALILLNTTKKEAYILWEATGSVTKLEDVPWVFLTAGPDVKTDGPQRAYFITSDAQTHVIDGSREMGKRSMCGTAADETVNGTFTAGTTPTTLYDTAATFPANCVGFEVHILSGDYQGESTTITTRNSDTQLTVDALSGAPAVGDRYSVAPIVTKITLPVLTGQNGMIDPFVRKIMKAMMCAFSDLGGETGADDTNPYYRVGMKEGTTVRGTVEADFNSVADKTVARSNYASTRPFPYLEFKGGNQDWELQAVVVKGILSMSEAQSRRGTA